MEKYGIAILASLNIIFFDRISAHFGRLTRVLRTPVQALVSRSFSIYLYQAPLLFFVAALIHRLSFRPARILILYGGALSLCILLAEVTERRKAVVSRALTMVFTGLRPTLRTVAGKP